MKESVNFQLPEYHFIQERTLRILSLHEDGLSIERLVHSVAQTMPPEFSKQFRELRHFVRQVLFDLKARGKVELHNDWAYLPDEEVPSLHTAASRGKTAVVKSLLDGAGVSDEERNEALISAVINNRLEAVKLLLEAGADVNAEDRLFGRTAMMYVTKRTRKEIIELLIGSGVKELQSGSDASPLRA
jgi:ankyrin repeat protein